LANIKTEVLSAIESQLRGKQEESAALEVKLAQLQQAMDAKEEAACVQVAECARVSHGCEALASRIVSLESTRAEIDEAKSLNRDGLERDALVNRVRLLIFRHRQVFFGVL
jgi:hypothetical protein